MRAHAKDVQTKWVGVPHDDKEPRLLVWPRLNDCFQMSTYESEMRKGRISADQQHPSLVSFFGETGAGKSTIIKALLKLQQQSRELQFPVTGSDIQSGRATSGDVHLYADQRTIASTNPILYAGKTSVRLI